ncbi:cysteine desulfurase [Ruminococcaceae bacterium YRB3002]|nr:cysteine desulfurase [Ruminococcaceae bacterium YRB3002]
MIYFDNSATTKPCQEVIDRISENLTGDLFANPGSLHTLGLKADKEYKSVTSSVASMLGAGADEIYFTSCGTESANTAVRGYLSRNKRAGNRIISTRTEHKATLETLKLMEASGYEVVYVSVGSDGKPDLNEIRDNLEGCALMCFTHVNNETGAILPLDDIVTLRNSVNRNCKIYLDCVQSLGKLDINLKKTGVDMASFSGHKIHGIKGVGVLYVKNSVRIDPLILGGGQQKGMRSGTESLVLASSFEAALAAAREHRETAFNNASEINSYLREELSKRGNTILSPDDALPFVLNCSFAKFESETMLHCLEIYDIFVSTVSACSSKAKKVSYVLLECGVDRKLAANAVRISLSRYSTMDDAREFIRTVDEIYDRYLVQ